MAARRIAIRERKRRAVDGEVTRDRIEAVEKWKEEKKIMRKAIEASKREKSKKLIEEVERDVWGRPYQMVVKKTRMGVRTTLDDKLVETVIGHLFPRNREENVGTDLALEEGDDMLREFTAEEVSGAGRNIRRKKAPGLDNVPQKLVLLPKVNKKNINDPAAHRPMCLLSTTSKLIEQLVA